MTFEVIIVFIVLVFLLVSLYTEKIGPGFTFLIGVGILGILKVITPKEMLAGFANKEVAIIIMLILLGNIFRQTSILDILFDKIFSRSKSYNNFMTRMMILISVLSAFLNNTPLVALMMPYVHSWSKRNKISPSKLFIPLSYAAILGGCATLIGTSTNLIVSSMVSEQTIIPGLPPMNIFDFTLVGAPMIVIGIIYIRFFGAKKLPDIPEALEDHDLNKRKYIIEVKITSGSKFSNKAIKDSELLNSEGLYIHEIIKKTYSISHPSENVILRDNDIIVISGNTQAIADIARSDSSLSIPSVGVYSRKRKLAVVEIVISHNSSLIGKSIEQTNLRREYGGIPIALHRKGESINEELKTIELMAGDALLLLTEPVFEKKSAITLDFFPISTVKEIHRLGFLRSSFLIGGTLAIIILSAFGVISLFMGLIALLSISIFLKISSPKELPKFIDYNLIFIIVLALAFGKAMIKTGAADIIANLIINVFTPLGKFGILAGIYFITSILAAYITNQGAAAIVFPISLTMAVNLNLNPVPFVLIVAFAAAANFMTPIGYQTNLMVFGPGRYKFNDYLKIGIPLTIIYMIVTVSLLGLVYF